MFYNITGNAQPVCYRLSNDPNYFEQISSDKKKFELRKNDRDYKTDDILILGEYDRNLKILANYENRIRKSINI